MKLAAACLFVAASAGMVPVQEKVHGAHLRSDGVGHVLHDYTATPIGSSSCSCDPETDAQSLSVTCREEEHSCK